MTNPSPHRYLARKAETEVLARLDRYNASYNTPGQPRILPADALSDVHLALSFGKEATVPRLAGDEILADDVVDALRLIPGERFRLDYFEQDLIEAAMNRGLTWDQLADQLGYPSKQAMQQRYRRLGGRKTWAPARDRPAAVKEPTPSPPVNVPVDAAGDGE
jgi:hypothetical protein